MEIVMCPKCGIKMKFDEDIQGHVCPICSCMSFTPTKPKKK